MTSRDKCKLKNFRENFVFANYVKRRVCDFKNTRLEPDTYIPISVNSKVKFAGKIKSSCKFLNLQHVTLDCILLQVYGMLIPKSKQLCF